MVKNIILKFQGNSDGQVVDHPAPKAYKSNLQQQQQQNPLILQRWVNFLFFFVR